MKYDPTLEVPPNILWMAREIDKWARKQGLDSYCLGPICSRDYASAYELMSGISTENHPNPKAPRKKK